MGMRTSADCQRCVQDAAGRLWQRLVTYPSPKTRPKKARPVDWERYLELLTGTWWTSCDRGSAAWRTMFGPDGFRAQDKSPRPLDGFGAEWLMEFVGDCDSLLSAGREYSRVLAANARRRKAKSADPELDWANACLSSLSGVRSECLRILASPPADLPE